MHEYSICVHTYVHKFSNITMHWVNDMGKSVFGSLHELIHIYVVRTYHMSHLQITTNECTFIVRTTCIQKFCCTDVVHIIHCTPIVNHKNLILSCIYPC